jgi:hypothetical protein
MKPDIKTVPTKARVDKFLQGIPDGKKRADRYQILELVKKATKSEPTMWGTSIVGFGEYHYVYESGREGGWLITGFAPRKQNLTFYVVGGFHQFDDLMQQLGKHSSGKGCLYINQLEAINGKVLEKLITKPARAAENKN